MVRPRLLRSAAGLSVADGRLLAGQRVSAEQTLLRFAEFGADALSKAGNRRADRGEDDQAKAHDGSGKDNPVNSDSAGFVFQESRELGHFWPLAKVRSVFSTGSITPGRCRLRSVPFHLALQSWQELGTGKNILHRSRSLGNELLPEQRGLPRHGIARPFPASNPRHSPEVQARRRTADFLR